MSVAKRPRLLDTSHGESKVVLETVWEVPPEGASEIPPRSDFAVAKYAKLKPLNAALLDSYTEGYQRTTTLFFGRIVSNPVDLPAFEQPLGYNMTYNAMKTGNGNALHRHNSVEVFVALDAPFEIAYGSNGEFKCRLQPWDIVACPAEAIHSYKNIGQDGGQILTFLCGKPAITWAPGVVTEARKNGAVCDDNGILLAHSIGKAVPAGPLTELSASMWEPQEIGGLSRQSTAESSQAAGGYAESEKADAEEAFEDPTEAMKRASSLEAKVADELLLEAEAIDKFVYRYAERADRTLQLDGSEGAMRICWIDLAPARAFAPEGDEDTLVIVLAGSVICQERHYTHLDVLKQPTYMVAGSQGAVVLVNRSGLPHNLDFFYDARCK